VLYRWQQNHEPANRCSAIAAASLRRLSLAIPKALSEQIGFKQREANP
jgi:hypothetical protein